MATPTAAIEGLFSDEVFTATDLNRRAGTVLDHARNRPVTISRNDEQFALLPREQAGKLFRTVTRMARALALLSDAHCALAGEAPSATFSWLTTYDKGDLKKLTSEVFSAVRTATLGGCDWDVVDAVIHEWRESAMVAQTGVLDSAMYFDELEELELPHPLEVVLAEGGQEPEQGCPKKVRAID
ncbi:MAG TPA: hypothetical protein VFA04_04960 [Bryobacteraceae bacterium]|nr:hypothetical protein [Bryobacteraceae bacterium]